MNMKIIGIAGTNGSGKDTVGDILAAKYGYLFVSVADLLREECRRRGLPVERENLRMISAEWRRKFGLGVLVDRAYKQFQSGGDSYRGLVAVPMRNVGEAERIHELGGVLVWVDADPKLRYKRVTERQRSPEDQKTFEQFMAEEAAEMNRPPGADAATLDMAGVKKICDIFIENNTDDLATFQSKIEQALNL